MRAELATGDPLPVRHKCLCPRVQICNACAANNAHREEPVLDESALREWADAPMGRVDGDSGRESAQSVNRQLYFDHTQDSDSPSPSSGQHSLGHSPPDF